MRQKLICTIITKSYLAHARALAESVRVHNPELPPLLVLLADRVDGYFDPAQEPFQMIQLGDLKDQEAIAQMSFYYTPFEFCCALRGLLHQYIMERTEVQSWMFLDSDIFVFHDLSDIFRKIDSRSIVLNPHLSSPANAEYVEITEITNLHAGLYNAGFLGLRRTDETRAFISWFQERLRWYCLADHPLLFVDQAWLNHVPLFFSNVSLLRDNGANVGHWNIKGRKISRDVKGLLLDGSRIKFVHFSGWDPEIPENVSRFNPGLDVSTCPGWDEVAGDYVKCLRRLGYDDVRALPYAFEVFNDGYPISLNHRRAYYDALRKRTWTGECPFSSRKEFTSPGEKHISLGRRLAMLLRRLSRAWLLS